MSEEAGQELKLQLEAEIESCGADWQAALEAEQTVRGDADQKLQAEIDALGGSSASSLQSETEARQAADTALQAGVDKETAAREAGDEDLQSEIDALKDIVSGELDPDGNIDLKDYYTSTQVDNLVEAARTGLQESVDTEASAREAADTSLQENIDAEASAREAADTAEAGVRAAADTRLQEQIDALAASDGGKQEALEAGDLVDISDGSVISVDLTGVLLTRDDVAGWELWEEDDDEEEAEAGGGTAAGGDGDEVSGND